MLLFGMEMHFEKNIHPVIWPLTNIFINFLKEFVEHIFN
jgi:hypothetical protein